MNRKDFFKMSGLSLLGLTSGILLPIKSFAAETGIQKLSGDITQRQRIEINTKDEMWVGWLARLAVSSLVTALGAKLVDKYFGDCYCNGTSCSPNNASSDDYYNVDGIYGYANPNRRFVRQKIYDQKIDFDNVSVPFLSSGNAQIMNIEGPFLAGICWATKKLENKYNLQTIRSVIVPNAEISNGGFRFDKDPCYSTRYQTNYGSTEVSYNKTGGNKGTVVVKARDNYDNLDWSEAYDFKFT